jgi:hypothetical protein
MSPRADWHLDVEVDRSDPFATPVREPVRVDLSDPDVLRAQLVELMLREGQLSEQGVGCELKDRPDSCCSACPLRGSRRAAPIRELCNLGQQQEITMMTAVAVNA